MSSEQGLNYIGALLEKRYKDKRLGQVEFGEPVKTGPEENCSWQVKATCTFGPSVILQGVGVSQQKKPAKMLAAKQIWEAYVDAVATEAKKEVKSTIVQDVQETKENQRGALETICRRDSKRLGWPTFKFQKTGPDDHPKWQASCFCTIDGDMMTTTGTSETKTGASELACYDMLRAYKIMQMTFQTT